MQQIKNLGLILSFILEYGKNNKEISPSDIRIWIQWALMYLWYLGDSHFQMSQSVPKSLQCFSPCISVVTWLLLLMQWFFQISAKVWVNWGATVSTREVKLCRRSTAPKAAARSGGDGEWLRLGWAPLPLHPSICSGLPMASCCPFPAPSAPPECQFSPEKNTSRTTPKCPRNASFYQQLIKAEDVQMRGKDTLLESKAAPLW